MNRTARTVLVILLVMLLLGMLPVWPYSAAWGWGYYPSGGAFTLLVIVLLVIALSEQKDRKSLP